MKQILRLSFIVIIFFSLALSVIPVFSQQFDSKGQDFWFTFIPNFHNYRNSEYLNLRYGDSLYIYVASEKPANGMITYKNMYGKTFSHTFSIIDTNKIYTLALCYYDIELLGYNDSGLRWQQNQCEIVAPQSFHLTSDVDVTVYALNQAITTSDAFMVYPTDILGEDYYIMSYYSDGVTFETTSRTPSQFAIVATEDNTIIDINATVPTYAHGWNQSWSISLNKGDVYLVQSAFDRGNETPDLTGTELKSNKPIAVFSGQQRAKLPVNVNSNDPSRDILVEQLQPYKNWGKSAFIIPFFQPYDISPLGADLFRVLAGKDSTLIYLNGNLITTLNKSEFFEANADRIFIVTSNNPISVMQYKKTSKFRGPDLNVSDPFMLVVPPKEQFQSSYRVINAQSWDLNSNLIPFKTFTEQYITLIVPDTAINSVTIDNKPTSASKYKSIPGSGYSFLNQSTLDGVHSIYANAPIGVYVYGYGDANSYGYLGGMNFIPLNFQPPRILGADSCHLINGKIEKYSRTDYGVWDVKVSSNFNTIVNINNFARPVDTLYYDARLINHYLDGNFTLIISDSLGNTNQKKFDLRGFTIGYEGAKLPEPGTTDTLPVIYDTIKARRTSVSSFSIINYGKFLQEIKYLRHSSTVIKQLSYFPKLLNPKSKYTVDYSVFYYTDTTIVDTVYIFDGCIEKPILILIYTTLADKQSPVISVTQFPCDTMLTISVTDSLKSDFGIQDLTVTESRNCSVEILSVDRLIAIIKVVQDRKDEDAIFTIIAIDSMGNKTVFSDTIKGHNLVILNINSISKTFSFGNSKIGLLVCDSILFYNKGTSDIVINNIKIFRNLEFSIPLSQLPFVLKGGETKALYICFKPTIASKTAVKDTFSFVFGCIESYIILEGIGEEIVSEGQSQCNIDMKMITKKVPPGFFFDKIYPNPISSSLNFVVGINKKQFVSFRIFDILGRPIQSETGAIYEPGIYEIQLAVPNLSPGQYLLIGESSNDRTFKLFIKSD